MWGIDLVDTSKEELTINNIKAESSPRHSLSSITSTEEEFVCIGTDQCDDDNKKGNIFKF